MKGQQCRHLDGVKANNNLGNLVWGSAQENAEDRALHGTTARGKRQGLARLTEEDIPEVRRRAAGGESQRSLARAFGVSQPAISYAVRRETWAHVP